MIERTNLCSHFSLTEFMQWKFLKTNSPRSLAFIRVLCPYKYCKVRQVASIVDYMTPYFLACHLFILRRRVEGMGENKSNTIGCLY